MIIVCYDIAAILLCMMLLISLRIRGLNRGRTNKMFLSLVVLVLLTGIFDVINELYGPVFPQNEFTISNQLFFSYLYFYIRNATTPFYILYVMSVTGIWHRLKEKLLLKLLISVPYGIDCALLLSNTFTGWIFGYTDDGIYYRGQYIYILYVIAFYYLIFGMILLFRGSKLVKMKMLSLFGFYLVNLVAVLYQFAYAEQRVESMASAITILIIALSVQRPDESIDEVVNTQSPAAFLKDSEKFFKTNRPMSIVFFKITNYSALRQNLGIEMYSKLLRLVSDRISRIDMVVKADADIYFLDRGGFAIVSDAHKKAEVIDAGHLLFSYMQEPLKIDELEIKVDIKIAYVSVPDDIRKIDTFFNFASTFSHSLPDNNRLLMVSDYSKDKNFRIKANIDMLINRAIENRNFRMYYQPIYSVKNDKFMSAEALIRLIDEDYGYISPGVFIPAAENSGAIHKIGDFVFEDVFRFVRENNLKSYDIDYVEINLSVGQCIEPNLVNKVSDILKKYNISSDMINLEITETAVDYSPKITDMNIEGLYREGFKFSLDDYGTGYSNINRVASLPIDIVKLDKSLVDEMDDPMMWIVIEHTVGMFKKIDKKILVEGVETKHQLDKFIELGVDYIQGFYFSKPLPEKEYIEFIKEHNK